MSEPLRFSLAPLLCLLGAAAAHAAGDPFADKVLPFVNAHCVRCHNKAKPSGEVDLTRYGSAAKALEDYRQWEHVAALLKKGEMPPAAAKQPTAAARDEAVAA